MSLNVLVINALFRQLAALCTVADNGFVFELTELPCSGDVSSSLAPLFSGVDVYTGKSYGIDEWSLRLEPVGDDVEKLLRPVLMNWLFGLPSDLHLADSDAKSAVIDQLCLLMIETFGCCAIHEVFVTPPCWYEACWQDFAFVAEDRLWFLHLGVSD